MQKFTTYITESLNSSKFKNTDALNEAKKEDAMKVVLLSNMNSSSYSIKEFEKEFKRNGIDYKIINIGSCKLKKGKADTGDFIISDENTKDFIINGQDTVILTRRGVIRSTYTRNLVETLENSGFFVLNTIESIMICENKYITSNKLIEADVPTPKSAIIENENYIESAVEEIGGKFPVILKTLSGSHGIGVSIIESAESLRSVLQTVWKVSNNIEVMVQEMINSTYDLRIHVLCKKFNSPVPEKDDFVILGAMKRNKIKKDFRTNYSLGGTVEKVKLTKEQEQIAIDAAKATGCNWCGVDIIVDKNKNNYVLEVNSSPGTKGIKEATGINIVKDIVEFISDKENWTRNHSIIGYRELIEVPGIGKMVAKFDTGNGSASSSITYDEIDVDEKKKTVSWKLGNKSFKNKLIGYSTPEVGDSVQKRPVIEIDIIFAGRLYKDVNISLVDRTEKSTKFLANRGFMERIGCTVDPGKTFILTEAPVNYNPAESKGKNHHGIEFIK